MESYGTITFPNSSCVALWNNEITGQLSDGAWENTAPHDHWLFWCHLEARVANLGDACEVKTSHPWKCKKVGYNLAGLYEYVGERMVATGKMGRLTTEEAALHAAEYMACMSFDTWKAAKDSGKFKNEFVGKYMESVSEELARGFFAVTYGMKELRKDIAMIKMVMKTMKHYGGL